MKKILKIGYNWNRRENKEILENDLNSDIDNENIN